MIVEKDMSSTKDGENGPSKEWDVCGIRIDSRALREPLRR